jgi:beta-N-acetylhexosaminidase
VERREFADLQGDIAPYRVLIANGLPAIMVAHLLVPAVDERPASFSRTWIRGVLREELRFSGAVFADDLSMQGAAAVGDIVERAELALAAGCDILPVCNNRVSVITLLDDLHARPDPASALRRARLRGPAGAPTRAELLASDAWRRCQSELERCAAPPALRLS